MNSEEGRGGRHLHVKMYMYFFWGGVTPQPRPRVEVGRKFVNPFVNPQAIHHFLSYGRGPGPGQAAPVGADGCGHIFWQTGFQFSWRDTDTGNGVAGETPALRPFSRSAGRGLASGECPAGAGGTALKILSRSADRDRPLSAGRGTIADPDRGPFDQEQEHDQEPGTTCRSSTSSANCG